MDYTMKTFCVLRMYKKCKFITGQRYIHVYKYKPRNTEKRRTPRWNAEAVTENIVETAKSPIPVFTPTSRLNRTNETNPANHTFDDIGRWYTIPTLDKDRLFSLGGIPAPYEPFLKAFNETSIMIRRPAVEIIDYLKRANYNKPAVRYVLYGADGAGKTVTISHILHYAMLNNFVIVHIPWVPEFFRWKKKEAALSERRQGFVDMPVDGAVILKRFLLQNHNILHKLDLRLTKTHEWNAREASEAGSELAIMVSFGINRMKYSNDCILALFEELRNLSTSGKCRTLFVINGFNAFYIPRTQLMAEDRIFIPTPEITITKAVMETIGPHWSNGAVLLSISNKATVRENRESYDPFYLLQPQGIDDLDPFVPVAVPELSDKEFNSLLDYYEDRRWIQKYGGREELAAITSRLPGQLMYHSRFL